jgi:uncharacterized protein (TIGR00288 family)
MAIYRRKPVTATKVVEGMQTQVALFIDFENIAISAEGAFGQCDLHVIVEAAQQWGRCVIKRAYGDWTRFDGYRHDLLEHSIEAIQMFRYGARDGKNAADIQMVADILENVFIHPAIDVFVLATGDSDFSAVARKLREYGKLVIGIGLRRATSEVLVKACDHFVLYDNLVEPETRTVVYGIEQGRQLLLDAMRRLARQSETGEVPSTQLKQAMLEQDPTFSEFTLGFPQFKSFLEAQSDLLETRVRKDMGTDLVVALRTAATAEPRADRTSQYRRALDTDGLRLLDPHTRTEVLKDLFHLLNERPGQFVLDGAISHLKAQYDATNILRSRDEVQEVAKLVKRADALEPRPQSWDSDRLALKPDLQLQVFVDRCESAYIATLLQQNLPIDADVLARMLFGTSDQRARVERLTKLAQDSLAEGATVPREAVGWEWPRSLRDSPELGIALQDLAACTIDEEPTLGRAAELNSQGLRIRTTDFERARVYFLKAARTIYDLLQQGAPGASLIDAEWYLASYCAATAGASFFRYDYAQASDYYLAFFSLARDTEPVWEKLQKLTRPMLSFFFTVAANEMGELLEVSPGRTHPARVAISVFNHPNPKVRQRWMALTENLARVNPAVLREVVQRLAALEMESEIPGAGETRRAIVQILQTAGPGTRERSP